MEGAHGTLLDTFIIARVCLPLVVVVAVEVIVVCFATNLFSCRTISVPTHVLCRLSERGITFDLLFKIDLKTFTQGSPVFKRSQFCESEHNFVTLSINFVDCVVCWHSEVNFISETLFPLNSYSLLRIPVVTHDKHEDGSCWVDIYFLFFACILVLVLVIIR